MFATKLFDRALARSYGVRHWLSRTTRNDYKGTWSRLSFFEYDAKIGVAGHGDEARMGEAAAETVGMLQATVGVSSDDVILEIGAGVGRVGAALAPLCRRWIGADVSPHMVAHMKRRLAAHDNVAVHEISGYDLAPIASSSVDVVYSTVVFMHLEEWDRYNYVCEARRVLRPGGRLLVDNVNLASDAGWQFFEHHRAFKPGRRKASISKTSTPQELRIYFERAGFGDIAQQERGPWIIVYAIAPGSKPTLAAGVENGALA